MICHYLTQLWQLLFWGLKIQIFSKLFDQLCIPRPLFRHSSFIKCIPILRHSCPVLRLLFLAWLKWLSFSEILHCFIASFTPSDTSFSPAFPHLLSLLFSSHLPLPCAGFLYCSVALFSFVFNPGSCSHLWLLIEWVSESESCSATCCKVVVFVAVQTAWTAGCTGIKGRIMFFLWWIFTVLWAFPSKWCSLWVESWTDDCNGTNMILAAWRCMVEQRRGKECRFAVLFGIFRFLWAEERLRIATSFFPFFRYHLHHSSFSPLVRSSLLFFQKFLFGDIFQFLFLEICVSNRPTLRVGRFAICVMSHVQANCIGWVFPSADANGWCDVSMPRACTGANMLTHSQTHAYMREHS